MVFSGRPRFLWKQNMEGIFTEEAEDVKEQSFTEYSGKWEYGTWGREVGDWAKKKKRRAVTWGWENWQVCIEGVNRNNQNVRLVSWVLLVTGCLRINLVFPWGWAIRLLSELSYNLIGWYLQEVQVWSVGDSGFSERNLLFKVEAPEERLRVHQGKHFLTVSQAMFYALMIYQWTRQLINKNGNNVFNIF